MHPSVPNLSMVRLPGMARAVSVAFGLAATVLVPGKAEAFDCAKAYLAVDHVICADPALIEKVDRLQEVWNTLRKALDEERRKALTAEQRQWIADYAARCGVPGRSKPSPDVISGAKACVGGYLVARTAYLEALVDVGPGKALPAPSAPSSAPAPKATPDTAALSKASGRTGKPEPVVIHIGDDHLTIIGEPPSMPEILGPAWDIQLAGPIDKDAAERFVAFLRRYGVPDGSSVTLHSPGGNLAAGMALGREFRRRAFTTSVGIRMPGESQIAAGRCYSACAVAFLGGKFRSVWGGSEYGVHRFAFRSPTERDADLAQVMSALLVAYIGEMGADSELFSVMTRASNAEMNVLSKNDLERLRVVYSGADDPVWSIESLDIGFYLKGQQETWRGIDKAMFLCTEDRRIGFTAMFHGNDHSFTVASGSPPQTLTVDKISIRLNDFDRATLTRRGDFVSGSYVLPDAVVAMIANADTIGYAIQPLNPAIYFGYQMKVTADAKKKMAGLIASCRR